ncbi:hypercellular protein HypA [Purpureocillium lavendulum]|uniref:Hypercellular protein HypA n=1 Tax=Purpureocillium lavendulum TaxID=1247861 RepID=A0AB34FIS7_9HYPO|nr:hypercellular protein HypA [Purpureocillium lavendulum]
MPYPSYETFWKGSGVELNIEADRLYWVLQDPIQDSIFVMDKPNDPTSPRQPGFLPGDSSDGTGPNLHPVAHLSLCEPPVSSVTVVPEELQDAADSWEDEHNYYEDDDTQGPCRCCDRRAPPHDLKLKVVASKEDGFVTIGDYVAAVHPWLMGLRHHFLHINTSGRVPWPEDTRLMVSFPYPDDVSVENESTWVSSQRIRVVGRQIRAEERALGKQA